MVPSHTIARIPASVSYIDAAAIPCAGLTAYNALYRRLNCGSGDIVLVHAGSGGVGGYAIQLAKRVGATVVATCSAANADYVRELGADEVIDYRTQNVFARAQEPQFWRQQEDLAKMASEMIALVERSEIRSTVSSVIPLEEMPKSLIALAEGHVRGKIVARLIRDY
jgi:NADPH:quinone reductase-like Zn-dependent oxidoreductase